MPEEVTAQWKTRLFEKLDEIGTAIASQETAIAILQFQVGIMWKISGLIGGAVGLFIIGKLLDLI